MKHDYGNIKTKNMKDPRPHPYRGLEAIYIALGGVNLISNYYYYYYYYTSIQVAGSQEYFTIPAR